MSSTATKAHTIITHTDSAGYCTGVPAFDIVTTAPGNYEVVITLGDRAMCGFVVHRSETRQLTSEQLGALVGNHVAFVVFACGRAVTKEWVARSITVLARLADPAIIGAFKAAFGPAAVV